MKTADDQINFKNFRKNFKIFIIACLYLESSWQMYQNEYKQAYVWSNASWDI